MTSVVSHNATRWIAAMVVAVVLAGFATGCSGGGGGDEIDPVESADGGRGGNDPSADDVEAVETVLADLLERHDEVVGEVLADPSVAQDETHELIQELRDLYSPDSAFPDQVIASWVADAEAGTSRRPAGAEDPVVSRLDGVVEVMSEDEVRFPLCQELRYVEYDADGNVVEMTPYLEQPGEATAVRVDGDWLLVQLTTFQGQAACPGETEGS